jgi:hypothetical protein
VITQCDDLATRRQRCEAIGVRIANEIGYPEYRELQLHPRDVGAAMLSFSWQKDARSPGGPWHPAAVQSSGTPLSNALGSPSAAPRPAMTAAELQSEDPERLARRWSQIIERPVVTRDGQRTIALDDATLRFSEVGDGRGEGLAGLDLHCTDATRRGLVLICGIRFRLIAP